MNREFKLQQGKQDRVSGDKPGEVCPWGWWIH